MRNWLCKCANISVIRQNFFFKCPLIKEAAVHGKEHATKFLSTDSNSDSYNCEIFLKKTDLNVELRLNLISSILAYPAFEQIWVYEPDEYKKAAKTFNKVVHVLEDLKVEYESDLAPGPTLGAMIREAMRPIDTPHKEARRQIPLDETHFEGGVADWRKSLYGNRYPAPIIMNVDKQYNYWGEHNEPPPKRHVYRGRGKE